MKLSWGQYIWWMQTQRRGGRQPSDQANRLGLRVREKEMAATVRIYHRHLLLLSKRTDTHFTVPWRVEGWVDLGLGVQPMPKAVYRSGCCDKHNCPRWDSNLGPLTPQSGMLLLSHCDTAISVKSSCPNVQLSEMLISYTFCQLRGHCLKKISLESILHCNIYYFAVKTD